MNRAQRNVRDFMKLAKQPTPKKLVSCTLVAGTTRIRLIKEEAKELETAILNGDMVGVVDGVVDLLYVTYGTAIAFGFDVEPFFDLVHENNMKKTWTTDELTKMPSGAVAYQHSNGRFVVLLDGKLIKPPGHTPPDVSSLLHNLHPTSNA